MNIYKSCDTLPIYFFYKIMETQDKRFLIKEYDIDSNLEITQTQQNELESTFRNIIYAYSNLVKSNKIKLKFERQIKIELLEFEYNFCTRTIELYEKYSKFEVVCLLREYGYEVRSDSCIIEQLNKINKKLKGLRNRIKILKINYANNYKEDEEEDNSRIMVSLEEEAIYLQMNLDLKGFIDTKETSVVRWFTMIEINKKKIAANGKINSKNKRSSRRG